MLSSNLPLADLSDLLGKGDVTLFIGAGLSIGVGLPGWVPLVRPLAQLVGYPLPAEERFITADHLLTALQHYENQRGRQSLIQRLRDALDTTGIPLASTIHKLIASLPAHIIFTTNYDDLIERALREAGRRSNLIVSESELALWSEDRVQFIKLCGSLERPESIIITKTDFNTYFATRPRLAERLRTTLESKTALFLGYSLQDPFFNQIWDHIGLSFGDLRRHGYAVLFDADPLVTDDLHRRGIHIVNLETQGRDRTAILEEWIKTLGDVGESPSKIKVQPAAPSKPQTVASRSTGQMDYDRGLAQLKQYIHSSSDLAEFAALQDRLCDNEHAQRVFGSSENTRNERSQIIYALNKLALKYCSVSFNDLCQGVEPKIVSTTSVEPSRPEPTTEARSRERLKLQLARLVNSEFEARALETPMGEPRATGRLPYTLDELSAVLKALGMPEYDANRFTSAQQDTLQRLGLVINTRFAAELHKRVGQALFDALMVGDVNMAFQMALNQARGIGAVALQLRFDEDAVQLAQYPWELLYYRRALLPRRVLKKSPVLRWRETFRCERCSH